MTDEADEDVADWLKDADEPADEAGEADAPADAPADDPLDWPPSEGAAGADDATDWERSPRDGGESGDLADGSTASRDADAQASEREQSGRARSEGDDAPLGDVAGDVRERRARASDRPDDRLFEEQDVTEIDADVVWDRLEGEDAPAPPEAATREVREVEKGEYCEHCPFFSPPPDVHCTNEGTEILELVDMEHFRVVDCPKVRENERLEQL